MEVWWETAKAEPGEQLVLHVQWDQRAERTRELLHFPRENSQLWRENVALCVPRNMFRTGSPCAQGEGPPAAEGWSPRGTQGWVWAVTALQSCWWSLTPCWTMAVGHANSFHLIFPLTFHYSQILLHFFLTPALGRKPVSWALGWWDVGCRKHSSWKHFSCQ